MIKHGRINTGKAVHAISVDSSIGTYVICGAGGSHRYGARITYTTEPLTCKWCVAGAERAAKAAADTQE